ncbi:MAG: hypothetical protein PHD38_03610 [Mesotoga sp.]|nr:hypothetical protein [Mesotoga sp.]MDI9367878.1 hypothetical protein [Thermotogota bacterium]MDD2333469.1 hypothetical protein [Mesotoga sp.]MDD3681414.1 hypothetical protein [Mesotoga sp.]MDD4207953.1 hypothetical protein [Mesotoga sp.]MDD4825229.1 hypothetical protein [Mesotoga sp.]
MFGQIFFFIVLLFWVGFDVYLFFFHNRRIRDDFRRNDRSI